MEALTLSLSSVFDLSFPLSETRLMGNESSPNLPVKIHHSAMVVDTKEVAEEEVVVDEVDSEKIEVEVVDTIDTLDDLSSNTSMP
jgi:hypothetical protein